jgi:hypothetical protein
MHGPRVLLATLGGALSAFAVLDACGSRTGLEAPPPPPDASDGPDAQPDSREASDVLDAPDRLDARDARDTAPDAPVDATASCDAGMLTAYLWSMSGTLYTFDPASLATQSLGTVACPASGQPWTLSVTRNGLAYMIYEDWRIYRVDLSTLACTPTPYVPFQLGFTGSEAIAVSRDQGPERLYVYGSNGAPTLAVTDFTNFVLSPVGPIAPNPMAFPVDMQGDAKGHLFALTADGTFVEIDAATATVLARTSTTFFAGGAWAIMVYGSQIYFFGGGSGNVSRYDPTTQQVTPLGAVNDAIVGASAAPCEP